MLGKLLKYDLKWCFKPLIVFYVLAIIFAIIIRVVESFEQTFILLIIDKICCGIGIAMMVNIIINCFMRNWARFIKNVYKDESYLTHTLPVSKNKIYLSKILTTSITIVVSIVVIITCIAIGALNEDTFDFIKISLEQVSNMYDISVGMLITVFLIVVILETIFMYMCGIFGIVLGYKTNNLKIVKSIVIGIVTYMVLSNFSIGILFVLGLLNPDFMDIFNNANVSPALIQYMAVFSLIIYTLFNLVLYFVGNKILNKGVNVD